MEVPSTLFNNWEIKLPFTVTVCFKEPRQDLVPEAWRILQEVVDGKELFPNMFDKYKKSVLRRWENLELNCQKAGAARTFVPLHDPPGSASGSDVRPPGVEEDATQWASAEDATQALKTMEPIGSVEHSEPDEDATPVLPKIDPTGAVKESEPDKDASIGPPGSASGHGVLEEQSVDWSVGPDVENEINGMNVEISDKFQQEVKEPVSDSSASAFQQELLLQDAK